MLQLWCIAVNVSDLAPALVALDAKIRTTKRVIDAGKFFSVGVTSTTVLDSDELVTELEIPLPPEASIQRYRKFRIRRSIDFAIVSVASVLSVRDGKIREAAVVLGAVAPIPIRVADAERFLVGREPDAETAEAAGAIAVRAACPLPKNAYKAQIVRAMFAKPYWRPIVPDRTRLRPADPRAAGHAAAGRASPCPTGVTCPLRS